jgi:hypothetical protein
MADFDGTLGGRIAREANCAMKNKRAKNMMRGKR